MLKEENSALDIIINKWERPCDACSSAVCVVYCHTDSVYLCVGCDMRIHAASHVASHHERVRVCEACEHAPAAFLCKADSASLCATCDIDIHSANPLARRHHRVPILPDPTGSLFNRDGIFETIGEDNDDEATSWLLLNPVRSNSNLNDKEGFSSYGGEALDEYLDLVDYNTCKDNQVIDQYSNQQQQHSTYPQKGYAGDSMVPVRNEMKGQIPQHRNYQFGMQYDKPKKTGHSYPASIGHGVSVSSMDVGVVPELTTSDVSISHPRHPKGTIELFSSLPIQMPTQLTPVDREARVLRYREKKKMRKFEKTIRYASRKAYAETRPRIKGRFVKRTDVEIEVDHMMSASVFAEGGYGIVPSY